MLRAIIQDMVEFERGFEGCWEQVVVLMALNSSLVYLKTWGMVSILGGGANKKEMLAQELLVKGASCQHP